MMHLESRGFRTSERAQVHYRTFSSSHKITVPILSVRILMEVTVHYNSSCVYMRQAVLLHCVYDKSFCRLAVPSDYIAEIISAVEN